MTNRELASAILLARLMAFGLTRADVRKSFGGVVRAFLNWRIQAPLVVYAIYIALCIWIARGLGLWNASHLKDTILWFLLAGIPLLFNVNQAGKNARFFRDTARSTVELGVFFSFFVNLVSLSLVGELILQILLAVLVGTRSVAASDRQYEMVKRLVDILLLIIAVTLSVYTARSLYNQRESTDFDGVVQSLLMTIWLPLVSLIFLFCFALFVTYELAFIRMDLGGRNPRPSTLRDKLALIAVLKTNIRDVHAFTGGWGGQVKAASTFRGALNEVRAFRANRRNREAQERKADDELRRFSGVSGADEDGRQLDRREFAATRNALRWVATCQMGHYRSRNGSYRPDLMVVLQDLTSYELPEDHSIELAVRDDGQAWYAWRRTVSGWVFAIGASAEPQDQWFYDGPDPPAGFPSADAGWDHFAPNDASRNW